MKEFIRNFRKQKVVGILNICTLSLGTMVAIIVGLWAMNELSFDSFHKDKESIYRIVQHMDFNGNRTKSGGNFKPLGEYAQAELPQIESMNRIYKYNLDLRIDGILHPNEDILMTDENFFTFFSFSLKEGDPATILSNPNSIILSENAAKHFYATEDVMGRAIEIGKQAFTISGVMKNMPNNSSIQADIIVPFFGWAKNSKWYETDSFITFIKLRENIDNSLVSEGIKGIILREMELFKSVNLEIELEPLKEMHFGTGFMFDDIRKGNKSLVMIFIIVAIVILIISCINFTNLFISTSFLRARTIGIKKSQGADKSSLVRGFYGETAFYTVIAIVFGLLLAFFLLPGFNNFTQSNLTIDVKSPFVYIFIILLFILTTLLAGTFPAFYLTRFNPIQTLGEKFKGKNISLFQKSLIIIQFAASIALLIVVSFMQRQVNYMVAQDLGFDKENVIYITGRGQFGRNFEAFSDDLMRDPSILDVTRKNSLPTEWQQGWSVKKTKSDDRELLMEICRVPDNYFDFFRIEIIQGENPFHLESTDSIIPAVLNERAVEMLGLENPIGEIFTMWDNYFIIKGVMKNVMVRSFHSGVDPQVYLKYPEDFWNNVLFFKIAGDPMRAISILEKKWKETEEDYPFEYHFLDDTYKQLYASEVNAGKVFSYAMVITFVISIAGLFAMSFYVTQRRIKEIGLRKINGGTLKDLLFLLNKDFILWVFISFIIAVPVAYIGLHKWLDSFTAKTSFSVWLVLGVGILVLIITLLTTSFQTWKVATMNPVEALKNE